MINLSKIFPKRKVISKIELKESVNPFGENEPLEDINVIQDQDINEAEDRINELIIHKEDDMNGKSE